MAQRYKYWWIYAYQQLSSSCHIYVWKREQWTASSVSRRTGSPTGEKLFVQQLSKATNISSYIHNYSEHPENVKISVFSSVLLRDLRIYSNEYLNSERETVTKIAREHQYPQYLIDKAYKSAHRPLRSNNNVLKENNDDQFKNILILTYNKNLLHLPTIFRRNFDVRLIFKNSNTIRNIN